VTPIISFASLGKFSKSLLGLCKELPSNNSGMSSQLQSVNRAPSFRPHTVGNEVNKEKKTEPVGDGAPFRFGLTLNCAKYAA
jgi:hypothetical protein